MLYRIYAQDRVTKHLIVHTMNVEKLEEVVNHYDLFTKQHPELEDFELVRVKDHQSFAFQPCTHDHVELVKDEFIFPTWETKCMNCNTFLEKGV